MTRDTGMIGWTLAAFAVFFAVYQPPEEKPLASPPAAVAHEATNGQDAPAVAEIEWLTWEDAAATGKTVFVFQHYGNAEDDRSCRPCRVMEKYLRDPKVAAFFTERGVLTSGTVEDWQEHSNSQSAPAIAIVRPDAKQGDEIPIIKGFDDQREPKGFHLSSPEVFLSDVKAWLDALENQN